MALQLLILAVFSLTLIKSAEWAVIALRRIARKSTVGVFAISAIILAVGTSLPELFVGITSALEGTPEIALGVVLGSNIANTAVITGFVALVFGRITVHGNYLKYEVLMAFIAGLLPLALMSDGILGRADGLILMLVYLAYAASFFKDKFAEITNEHNNESFFYRFIREVNHIDADISKEYGKLFISLAGMLFSAELVIGASQKLAVLFGIPVFVVGLIVLAIGTSLPELVFSLKSVKDGEPKMFFGNLLGSTIANSTLVVGLTAAIHPIRIANFSEYAVPIMAFILVFAAFWLFIRTKHRIDRFEAIILIAVYLIFIMYELW